MVGAHTPDDQTRYFCKYLYLYSNTLVQSSPQPCSDPVLWGCGFTPRPFHVTEQIPDPGYTQTEYINAALYNFGQGL